MKKPIVVGLLMIFVGTGCDRKPQQDQAHATAWTAAQQAQPPAKPARSIMRPAIVEPEPAPPPPPPAKFTISFADRSPALNAVQRAVIDPLIARLAGGTDRIILRGSTDSLGSDKRNLAVSRRRARMIATYLEQKGIARSRISIVALGESRPVAPNMTIEGQDDPEGRARNRRVDLELVPVAAQADPRETR